MQWWQQTRTALLDLIFPPRCCACGRNGQWFCANCIASITYIQPPICARCGQELEHSRECASCRRHPLPASLAGLRAVAHFEGTLRDAIHALKYEPLFLRAVAEPLGDLLVNYLHQNSLPFTVLIPVPLHIEKQRERGYNQAELLARVINRRMNKPLVVDALNRERNTISQVGLNESERRQNVRDAFRCVKRLDGTQVLLIDDVCTTGATMIECARTLHDAGAMTVWGLTLAR